MHGSIFSAQYWDRLLVKQAVATFAIALIFGAITSVWEIATEWRVERATISREIPQQLNLVDEMATRAAFELSQDLADEVVQGLSRNPFVAQVRLADSDGKDISVETQLPAQVAFPQLATWLMGDVTQYSHALQARARDAKIVNVGLLTVSLDPGRLTLFFLSRVWEVLWLGMLQAALVCFPVVLVFHYLITRPLLTVTREITEVDPANPMANPVEIPRFHNNDELGELVNAINTLLFRFQHGLMDQAIAEQNLRVMAHSLEMRVAERTADLEQANRSINDGISYAARLQSALLPPKSTLLHAVSEWTVGWQPLDEVGGDFYWAGSFGHKAVVALIDCTGHGVPGAFMSAVASSALVRVIHHLGHDDPAEILAGLNLLVQTTLHQNALEKGVPPSNDGLDAAICVIDTKAKQVTFAGATLPLIVQTHDDQRTIPGNKVSIGYADSPLDYQFTNHVINYQPGDTFMLFTDGVTDQVGGPNRRLLGRARLEAILVEISDRPLEEQRVLLMERLQQWRGAESRRDDMTFLAFRPI